MLGRSVQDRLYDFIRARGERGVATAELAHVFLCPASAPPELLDRLVRSVLSGDPRFVERPDGRWTVRRAAESLEAAAYTVVETLEAAGPGGTVPLEWAGLRLDQEGREAGGDGSAIRPPAGMRPEHIPPHMRGAAASSPDLSRAVSAAVALARGSTVVSFRPGAFQAAVARALVSEGASAPLLALGMLARRLLGPEARTPEGLAAVLGVPIREAVSARDKARFTAELLAALLASREELGLGEPEDWLRRQHPRRLEVDFSAYEFDREFLERLPEGPGIYILRDANGDAIYVGKAVNLRRRVSGYFRPTVERDEKTQRILEEVSRIEVERCGSELAALLAEFRAIRDLQPRINIQFEVHERPAAVPGPTRRVALVLPAAEPAAAEVFLLYSDRAMRQLKVPREEAERLRPVVEEFFFGPSPPEPDSPSEVEELRIAWSWLERNADRANAFDVDLAGGLEGTLRLLDRYLREPGLDRRVFHL